MISSSILPLWSLLLVTLLGVRAEEPKDKFELLIGKWEVTAAKRELPVGTVVEFGKDGKVTFKVEKETIEGTFKVVGDKLHLTFQSGNKEDKKAPATIKKLTDREMVLEGEKETTFEFKRVK
jgi:uncharacterized protein (TIGR03066 family)